VRRTLSLARPTSRGIWVGEKSHTEKGLAKGDFLGKSAYSIQQSKGGDPMISRFQVNKAVAGFSGFVSDRMTTA